MEPLSLPLDLEQRIFTVAELNAEIHALLEREFQDIRVFGEISGVKAASSGHCYFILKDESAQLRCVCFRSTLRYLAFQPQDGAAVLARGRLDVYEARGEYQLLVEFLEPRGRGAFEFAFEQLKKKLGAEGLFDSSRKRPLPRFPRRIGIVTSPKGAVIRDMLQVFERRFPGLHIRLYPAQVQGEGSVAEVSRGIEYFSQSRWADVVIVARGGGSLEDLWTFNEEAVARAIAACSAPVISAIGHETDVTIADFVADLRAPTPSSAAEMVISTRRELLDQISAAAHKLKRAVRFLLAEAARKLHRQDIDRATSVLGRNIGRYLQRVDELEYRLRERVRARLAARRRRHQDLDSRLAKMDLRLRFAAARRRLGTAEAAVFEIIRLELARVRARLEPLAAQLAELSPLRVLERGYAIVEDEAGRLIKDAAAVEPDSSVRVRLARGRLRARVTESIPGDNSGLLS